MVFSSLIFLFRFLPVVLVLYYIVPRKFRNFILFVTSLFFYAWGEPVYVCLLLISTVLDYTVGRLIGHYRDKGRKLAMKLCLLASLTVNLGLLGVFKYAAFFVQSVNSIAGAHVTVPDLALPIGISFYTFQTLSYSIDVYRDQVKPQHNIISFGAYVALFPQLIAGPIVRYKTIAAELDSRKESLTGFVSGAVRFSVGLAKKVLIANSIGAVFSDIAAMPSDRLTFVTAWLGVIAFTFQIYYDFSGYSDMAIGLGRMFGFHFPENFDHPYESRSVTEFWRRWHISLGSWFREYVYIPLGGNRKGLTRQMINIFIVWTLTGLWHGASWNFVLWGLYYGVILVVEKVITALRKRRCPCNDNIGSNNSEASIENDSQNVEADYKNNIGIHNIKKCGTDSCKRNNGGRSVLGVLSGILQHTFTMIIVIIGWAFFCYPDIADGPAFVGALTGQSFAGFINDGSMYIIISNILLYIIAIFGSTSLLKKCAEKYLKRFGEESMAAAVGKSVIILVCLFLSVVFLVSDSFNPFLYFRF